jgi:response regulator NasT
MPLAMRPNSRIDAQLRKILIIEDDPVMAMALRDELELEGYRVVAVADNSSEAVALAEQHKPDLVMADVRLIGPEDGIETAIRIARAIRTKIVFVTAHVDAETRRRMSGAGFHRLIPKPYTSEQLLGTVREALSQAE